MKPLLRTAALICCLGLFVACNSQTPEAVSNGLRPTNAANGTTLTATITATAKYVKKYKWTIEKTADPTSIDMFTGDSKDVTYTVKLTRDGGTVQAYLEGQVCVTNGGAVATENLAISVDLFKTGGPNPPVLNTVTLDLSSNPVLDPSPNPSATPPPPGETGCYTYTINIPSPVPGDTYKVTADVTITNHSGHLGVPFGPNPSATDTLPATPTVIDGSVHVTDTNGMSWDFTDSGSVTYTKTFTCDKDKGEYKNTASFTTNDTGATGSSSATVTVRCYKLEVSKTASTSFTRTHKWKISKRADQSSLILSTGQAFMVNYTVSVNRDGFTDSNWAVKGKITVNNPAPIAATVNNVSDAISGVGAVSVNCGVSFPYSLTANSSLECSYSSSLPDGTNRTNTATATLQNTPSGTTDFSGTVSVDFGSATITEKDTSVTVTDSLQGTLGTTSSGATYTYTRTISYANCGQYQYGNTATFTTVDTGTTGSSSWTVNVNVPCAGGCTLTQGYWKTHSDRGPAPYDDGWKKVGWPEEDTAFFNSGLTWYQVFWTPPAGNAFYNLAHQYMAAKLNMLNSASSTAAVDAAIANAEALFNSLAAGSTSLTATQRKNALAWASTLDQYNNGIIGPGHCNE